MNRRRIAFIYLGVGGVLLFFGTVLQSGVYSGFFSGKVISDAEILRRSIRIQAETTPRWYWVRPSHFNYSNATMEILGEHNRKALIDLKNGMWQTESDQGVLSTEGFTRFFNVNGKGTTLSSDSHKWMDGLLSFLQSMRDGTLLRVRHHTHYVDSPISASYLHGCPGTNYGFFAFGLWIPVWPVLLFFMRQKIPNRRFAPLKAYFLTILVIAAMDGILIIVGSASSPGTISELVEFLLAVVNLPSWILLGNHVHSWAGYIFGPLGWATVVSMVVLNKIEPQDKTTHPENGLV